jgi:hypothetical protein
MTRCRCWRAEAVRWEAESYRTTAAFLPTIVGWLSEPDDGLAAHAPAPLPWLPANPAAVSAPSAPVAVAAAVALAYLKGNVLPEHALSILIDATAQDLPTGVTGWDRLGPAGTGWDRRIRGFVTLALQRAGLS